MKIKKSISVFPCGQSVRIANPWVECTDLSEAEHNVGFSLTVPDSILNYKMCSVQTLGSELVEVTYRNPGDDGAPVSVRKGVGDKDISGDYNVYAESVAVKIKGVTVQQKGNGGFCKLVIWTDCGYTYAISLPGIDFEQIALIVGQVR